MKIWIDGYEANVLQRVGSGQVAFELLCNIHRLDSKNEYLVLLPAKPLEDLPKEKENFKYKILKPKRLWTRFALPLFLSLSSVKPDIFFSPTHYGPKFIPKGIKKIITIFDLSYLHFPAMFKKRDLYKLTNWTKDSAQKADKIITISKSSKADLVKQLKIDPKKIVVAYPGYDNQLFRPINQIQKIELIKKRYNISGKYIIYVGTVQPRKNLPRLIEAIAKIEEVKLVVVGKNILAQGRQAWGYEESLNKPKELGIEDRVIFTGFVPNQDLPFLFSGAKCFVLPSLYEGFGIPILEAMACGCPVVTANVSSLPEVVGKAGLLVDPISTTQIEQALRLVLTDQKVRAEMVKKGFWQVKKFSWEKMAKEVIKMFKELK